MMKNMKKGQNEDKKEEVKIPCDEMMATKKGWLQRLQEEGERLYDYSLVKFIKTGQNAFLAPEVVKMLDQLKDAPYMTNDLLFDLYVLAFAFRNTSHFQKIVNGCRAEFDPPLLPWQGHPCENENTPEEKTQSKGMPEGMMSAGKKTIDSISNQLNLFSLKISCLQERAEKLKEKMRKLFSEYSFAKNKRKVHKNESIFRKIYERERTSKCNVAEILKHEANQIGITSESLRRGYYRWKREDGRKGFSYRGWPSDAFLKFCAFISVKYEEESGSKSYILYEMPDIEAHEIYTKLNEAIKNHWRYFIFKKEFDKASACKDNSKKETILRTLAGKNYLPAIMEYIALKGISERTREAYLRRAAILGNPEAIKELHWQALGIRDWRLKVASQNRLRVSDVPLTAQDKVLIKPMPILRKIKFQINTNTDAWRDVSQKFKDYREEPPEYLVFSSGDWKTVFIDATIQNYDLLMRNVGSLKIRRIWMCFSSRHSKKMRDETFVAIDYPAPQGSEK